MGMFDWLSPTAGSDQGGMGLMGMLANPQTAGLLGMAGGLLQASGPSRLPVSNGMALGSGFQGMQQGMQNAIQNQRQMLTMRAMQGLMGGPEGSGPQSSGPAPSMSALGGPNSTMLATMGGSGGSPDGSSASGAPQASPAGIYGRTPQQLFQQGMLMNMAGIQGGGDLMRIAVEHDPTLAMQMPTDISKMGYQGGMTPAQIQAANAAGVAKANYIAPVNARPGAILRDPLTMQPMAFNPNIPAGGTPVFDASGNVVGINSIPGAADVVSQMAGAKTAGEGSAIPFTEGKDANGNPLPIMSRTQAATGNLPLPLRNNNPGAVSPGGSVAQYPDLQTGLSAMDQNLSNYANDPKVRTLGDAVTKWVGSAPNAPAYIKDVSTRLGIPANTPIDLTNPAQRQAIATAIMLHENGPAAVFRGGQGTAPAQGGAIYAAPPMGATTAANASQGAPSKQMADAYGALSSSDANYQASRAALQSMMDITNKNAPGDSVARLLPQEWATKLSNDAAEYEKAHALFTSLQGKSLGSGGTDASRANQGAAVPDFTKPQQARLQGLNAQLQQLDMNHLKTQFLTPTYQAGNEKQYTQLSAAFDQNIKPAMMPVLMMEPGQQQKDAYHAIVNSNPALKQNFQWALDNGMLK